MITSRSTARALLSSSEYFYGSPVAQVSISIIPDRTVSKPGNTKRNTQTNLLQSRMRLLLCLELALDLLGAIDALGQRCASRRGVQDMRRDLLELAQCFAVRGFQL